MSPNALTRAYYAKWLGVDPHILDEGEIHWVYNACRNDQPIGYPCAFDLYTFITQKTIIVSYGDKAADKIPILKGKIAPGMTPHEISAAIEARYPAKTKHSVKYVYADQPRDAVLARKLSSKDYPMYLDFFRKANPNCKDTSWVEAYYHEISGKGYCHGVVINDRLVSATDAPDMPYMSGMVQELGINTLPDYRGKGYAGNACLSCIKDMLRADICPQWSTAIDNLASQKLAASVGFERYFDNLCVSL